MKRDLGILLTGILASIGLFSCSPSVMRDSRMAPEVGSSDSSPKPLSSIAEERPGLATGWGREKDSPITSRSFVRASSKPAGIDSIYYNNPEGIAAMTSRMTKVEGMQIAAGGLVEWGIKGKVGFLPTYKEGWGNGRRLVAGARGSSYTIAIRNRSKSTLEIVASVDGLDVQDGKSASFSKRGYLVDPGKTLEIDGFRNSYDTVAAFEFSSVSGSYANLRHGETRNVGVIGIAVFTQKGIDPWSWMPKEIKSRQDARPFAEAPPGPVY